MNNGTGEIIARKVKILCSEKGITIKDLERSCGFSNGYIHKMSQGQTPSIDRLTTIAQFFGVTNDVLTGNPENKGTKIPLLGRVAAGVPIEASENIIGYEEIPSKLSKSANYFALLIKGDSMSPYICNGDKVIIRQQEEVESGQIAIVLINGSDAVCKEYKRLDNGIMLISKNPNYDPMIFTEQEIASKPVRIIGRVIEIRREV